VFEARALKFCASPFQRLFTMDSSFTLASLLGLCSLAASAGAACAKTVPPAGFVRLGDVVPTIAQDMRYAGSENFTGRPVPGYRAPRCWLRVEAARALAAAQEEAAKEGLKLVVYDCYRPPAATQAFIAWAEDAADQKMKDAYYPRVDKRALFDLGYIAKASTHTTGLAVDLAFEGLDFGTPFDLFDDRSATADPSITGVARVNRDRLVALMVKHGFENLPNEWWHFTFKGVDDPKPVDFEVE
jgi:D-alanyl-D-alanine dipeptidase